jgi:hypothetical protein
MKRTFMLVTIAFAMAVVDSAVASQKLNRVAVFVVADRGAEGFIAPGVPDSVRDVKSEIPKRSSLRLVATAEEADIVLRVLERRKVRQDAQGAVAFPVGAGAVAVPIGTEGNLLETIMEIGDYRRPIDVVFTGTAGVWRECAEQVSKRLHEWVVANREQIAARKK